MQFRTGATLAAAMAVISLTIAQSSWGGGGPLVVDDLKNDCPNADFTSIQAAVDAAIDRGRKEIRVCKGTYRGSVTVPQSGEGLVIDGPGRPANPDTCTATGIPNPLKDAVVIGGRGFGISVEADGVTVR